MATFKEIIDAAKNEENGKSIEELEKYFCNCGFDFDMSLFFSRFMPLLNLYPRLVPNLLIILKIISAQLNAGTEENEAAYVYARNVLDGCCVISWRPILNIVGTKDEEDAYLDLRTSKTKVTRRLLESERICVDTAGNIYYADPEMEPPLEHKIGSASPIPQNGAEAAIIALPKEGLSFINDYVSLVKLVSRLPAILTNDFTASSYDDIKTLLYSKHPEKLIKTPFQQFFSISYNELKSKLYCALTNINSSNVEEINILQRLNNIIAKDDFDSLKELFSNGEIKSWIDSQAVTTRLIWKPRLYTLCNNIITTLKQREHFFLQFSSLEQLKELVNDKFVFPFFADEDLRELYHINPKLFAEAVTSASLEDDFRAFTDKYSTVITYEVLKEITTIRSNDLNAYNLTMHNLHLPQVIPGDMTLAGSHGDEFSFLPESTYQLEDMDIAAGENHLRKQYKNIISNGQGTAGSGRSSASSPFFHMVPSLSAVLTDPEDKDSRIYSSYHHFKASIKMLVENDKSGTLIFFGVANLDGNHYVPYFIHRSGENVSVITVSPSAQKYVNTVLDNKDKVKDVKFREIELLEKIFHDIFPGCKFYDPNVTQQLLDYDCGFNALQTIDDVLSSACLDDTVLQVSQNVLIIRPELLTVNVNDDRLVDYYSGSIYYPKKLAGTVAQVRSTWEDHFAESGTVYAYYPEDDKPGCEVKVAIDEHYSYKDRVIAQYSSDRGNENLSLITATLLNDNDKINEYTRKFIATCRLPDRDTINELTKVVVAETPNNDWRSESQDFDLEHSIRLVLGIHLLPHSFEALGNVFPQFITTYEIANPLAETVDSIFNKFLDLLVDYAYCFNKMSVADRNAFQAQAKAQITTKLTAAKAMHVPEYVISYIEVNGQSILDWYDNCGSNRQSIAGVLLNCASKFPDYDFAKCLEFISSDYKFPEEFIECYIEIIIKNKVQSTIEYIASHPDNLLDFLDSASGNFISLGVATIAPYLPQAECGEVLSQVEANKLYAPLVISRINNDFPDYLWQLFRARIEDDTNGLMDGAEIQQHIMTLELPELFDEFASAELPDFLSSLVRDNKFAVHLGTGMFYKEQLLEKYQLKLKDRLFELLTEDVEYYFSWLSVRKMLAASPSDSEKGRMKEEFISCFDGHKVKYLQERELTAFGEYVYCECIQPTLSVSGQCKAKYLAKQNISIAVTILWELRENIASIGWSGKIKLREKLQYYLNYFNELQLFFLSTFTKLDDYVTFSDEFQRAQVQLKSAVLRIAQYLRSCYSKGCVLPAGIAVQLRPVLCKLLNIELYKKSDLSEDDITLSVSDIEILDEYIDEHIDELLAEDSIYHLQIYQYASLECKQSDNLLSFTELKKLAELCKGKSTAKDSCRMNISELGTHGFNVDLSPESFSNGSRFFRRKQIGIELFREVLDKLESKYRNYGDFVLGYDDLQLLKELLQDRYRYEDCGYLAAENSSVDKLYIVLAMNLRDALRLHGEDNFLYNLLMPHYPIFPSVERLADTRWPSKLCELMGLSRDQTTVDDIPLKDLLFTDDGYPISVNWIIKDFENNKTLLNPYTEQPLKAKTVSALLDHGEAVRERLLNIWLTTTGNSDESAPLLNGVTTEHNMTEASARALLALVQGVVFPQGDDYYYSNENNQNATQSFAKFAEYLQRVPEEEHKVLMQMKIPGEYDTVTLGSLLDQSFGDQDDRCVTGRGKQIAKLVYAFLPNEKYPSNVSLSDFSCINKRAFLPPNYFAVYTPCYSGNLLDKAVNDLLLAEYYNKPPKFVEVETRDVPALIVGRKLH